MIFPEAPSVLLPSEANFSSLNRRRALGGLGLAGLSLLGSASSASAFISGPTSPKVTVSGSNSAPAIIKSSQRIDLRDLSPEWAQAQGPALKEYVRYIWNIRLKNISTEQVIRAHAKQRGTTWNIIPPKPMWSRMVPTLRVVDRIAQEMGVNNVEIVSAYRSPNYNSRCEGARPGSWHQANAAVDVKFPVSAYQVASTARALRDRGLFKGGVGSYSGFTHVDTRGENVNW